MEYRKIGKVKTSLVTTLPKSIAENLGIKKGDVVTFYQESKRIILEKVDVSHGIEE